MKNIIFIGGSSHSGSKLLDLMIYSHPECFSAGGVNRCFDPSHHIDPICGCGVKGCAVWKDIHAKGEKKLYENIFFKYPSVDTIVEVPSLCIVKEKLKSRVKQIAPIFSKNKVSLRP